ncbi:hypothetical protein C1646_686336 [Rhizophagus diaphanus]|nr:hypothetical protein C1646_686336 [Rhizophagus diaphanus] [Rhizophagus sp. MUCL 43196]
MPYYAEQLHERVHQQVREFLANLVQWVLMSVSFLQMNWFSSSRDALIFQRLSSFASTSLNVFCFFVLIISLSSLMVSSLSTLTVKAFSMGSPKTRQESLIISDIFVFKARY